MIQIDPANVSEDVRRLNPALQPVSGPTSKPRKYRNEPTEYNGRRYASIKEAKRAQELDLMVKAGEIVGWVPQFPVPLEGGRYIADFLVVKRDGTWELEDVKGKPTQKLSLYRRNRRAVKERYGREIVEV